MQNIIKVLLVDDEAAFRLTTAKILEREGFEVDTACDGESALACICDREPDVVVLDVDMGGSDGNAALDVIKQTHPMVAVIMLTGHDNTYSVIDAVYDGAFDYLTKPCDIPYLISRIYDAYASVANSLAWMGEKQAVELMIPVNKYTSITKDCTVREAFQKLLQHNRAIPEDELAQGNGRRSLLVLDETERIIGYLTCHELLAALHNCHGRKPMPQCADTAKWRKFFWRGVFTRQVEDLLDISVESVMDPHNESVEAGASLFEVAEEMFSKGLRRILVSDQGEYVGIIRDQELFAEIGEIALRETTK